MMRQTIVPSSEGLVLVSTVSGQASGRRRFETMVFPIIDLSGKPDFSKVLYEEREQKARLARRQHRIACQQFDKYKSSYSFSDGQYTSVN